MSTTPRSALANSLAHVLETLCDDLMFSLLADESLNESLFRELCKRRASLLEEILRGAKVASPLGPELSAWLVPLVRDIAPSCPPAWLPMHELLSSGLTLSGGARGVRSLFSSKPSDKDELRVRRLGSLAVKVLMATLSSDAPVTDDERRLQLALVASLGLPAEEEAPLLGLGHVEPAQLEVLGELEAKSVKQLLHGAWQAALQDGLDAQEEDALVVLASKLGLKSEDLTSIGTQVKQETEERRALGRATVDALFWVLGDEAALARALSVAVTSITTPQPDRGAVLASLAKGAPPTEVQRATLSRSARAAALAITWAAVLRTDPSFSRKAELAARHERVAEVFGGDGLKARETVETLLREQLSRLAALATRAS